MFRLFIIAIIRELKYCQDISSVSFNLSVNVKPTYIRIVQQLIDTHYYMFTVYWHMIHCLCLHNILVPWWWLQ